FGEAASRLLSSVASPSRSVGLRDSGEVAPSAPRARPAPWALPTGFVGNDTLPPSAGPPADDAGSTTGHLTDQTNFMDHSIYVDSSSDGQWGDRQRDRRQDDGRQAHERGQRARDVSGLRAARHGPR